LNVSPDSLYSTENQFNEKLITRSVPAIKASLITESFRIAAHPESKVEDSSGGLKPICALVGSWWVSEVVKTRKFIPVQGHEGKGVIGIIYVID
jgi:hypothetical protein